MHRAGCMWSYLIGISRTVYRNFLFWRFSHPTRCMVTNLAVVFARRPTKRFKWRKFARSAPTFQSNPDLTRIARARSFGMAQGIVPVSHLDTEGDFVAEGQVRGSFGLIGITGESIAERGASADMRGIVPFSPEEFSRAAVSAWMESDEHRANIVNPHFNLSGIGVAMVHDRAVATQVFHGP